MIRLIRNHITGGGDSWPSDEGNLLDWMAENAPEIADKRVIIEFNAEIICDTGKDKDADKRCNRNFTESDNVIIRIIPEGLDPLTIGIIAVGALSALATVLLIPTPSIPNNVGEEKSSPNNQLTAAKNEFRPRQAIPDIAGSIRSYPDFIQTPYFFYNGGSREYTEVMCIGVGHHSVENFRFGSDLFSSLTGYSANVYQPGEHPNTLLNVRASEDSKGVELQPIVEGTGSVNISSGSYTDSTRRLGIGAAAIDRIAPKVGDMLTIDIVGYFESGGETVQINPTGTYEVESVGSTEVFFTQSIAIQDFLIIDGNITNNNFIPLERWFTLPGENITSAWFYLVMPQGIRSETGTDLTVEFRMDVQKIDASGQPIESEISRVRRFQGRSLAPRSATFIMNGVDGMTAGRYRARVVRLTATQPQPAIDLLQQESIRSVEEYTPNFGNVTIAVVNRSDSPQARESSGDRISAEAGREIPIFNPETGTFGARSATRSAAQQVMYLHALSGGSLNKIDYQGLFEEMPDGQLGFFDFSFDDKDIGVKQRIATACNVARVRAFTIGGDYLAFAREESKPVNQALFGRRDIAPRSVKEVWLPHRSSDYDSVEVEYVNPVTNAPAYERRRINSAGVIEQGQGNRVQTMQLAGCRTPEQAANRADYEIRKMRYQRRRLTITALRNAQDVIPGMRVAVESVNDSEVFGGEILSVEGNIYRTSEAFVPEAGKDYYVFITDEMGALSNMVLATAVSGDKMAFQASGLTAFVADGYEVQVGSRYVIAEAIDHERQSWTVVSRGRADEFGRVNLELVNYDERLFEED